MPGTRQIDCLWGWFCAAHSNIQQNVYANSFVCLWKPVGLPAENVNEIPDGIFNNYYQWLSWPKSIVVGMLPIPTLP